jgi:large subunit ribosomal protein L18
MQYRMIRHRRRSATTNYKKRIAALKGGMRRVVVRKSNKAITMQIVDYEREGDKVIMSVHSSELKASGWEPRCNIPTAYLTGMLLAKKANDKKSEFILDIGLYRPVKGSVIFAAAKGFQDNGAKLRGTIDFDSARLSGSHIATYAGKAKDDEYKARFSGYVKSGFDVKSMDKKFESIKKELMNK